ncbi:ABC transporter permease [Clostridium sp. C105KSO13]|uniref:ABC transporter permease n=1 Tax=Clostridium sp. C105KSO13 TaxID=1776045 RepID=UPI0007406862|nr:ABC transporter permease [Clostridium sp. C105KSO13]CUX17597.1 Inner membrane ABC transporter permease protein YjfF [Clostridium sp. C105KSO13]
MSFSATIKKNQTVIFCYAVALVLFGAFSIYMPGFASAAHIKTIFIESALIGFVAIGQTLVIITGGIDLSVAWMMTTAAYMVTNFIGSNDANLVWAVPLVLLLTFGLGAVNGLCISYLRVPAIVMTLGMNIILQGAVVAVTQGAPGQAAPKFLITLGQDSVFGIPIMVIIWLIFTVIVMIMMFKMKFGRRLFSIGNNAVVANYSGIKVNRVITLTYALSGMTAGIAGLLMSGKIGSYYLAMGDTYQFQSIAAVAIGGTSMLGGSGNYLGSIAGSLTITILLGILVAMNLPFGVQKMAYGLIVLVSIIISVRRSQKV